MFLLREIFILIALFMACIFLYLLWIQTKGIRIRFSRSPGYYQKGQFKLERSAQAIIHLRALKVSVRGWKPCGFESSQIPFSKYPFLYCRDLENTPSLSLGIACKQ